MQVGEFGMVPWAWDAEASGRHVARGIWVKDRAQTDTFFMKLFGWATVNAKANATAFMGPAVDVSTDIGMFPIGFFTDTVHMDQLVIGQSYTLIDEDSRYGSGNWGYISYNGSQDVPINEAWAHCGFNPTVTCPTYPCTAWSEWANSQALILGNDCADYANSSGAAGPAIMYQCADTACNSPDTTPIQTTEFRFGEGTDGWWIGGSSGSTRTECADLASLVNEMNGLEVNVPMIDKWSGGGSSIKYHLRTIGRFRIENAQIDCHAPGGGGTHVNWFINGTYLGFYLEAATGHHGDIRHASASTVFLDN